MRFIRRGDDPAVNLDKVQAMRLSHFQFSSLLKFEFEKDTSVVWRFEDSSEATATYDRILSLYSETV